jgi:hypothetical protein
VNVRRRNGIRNIKLVMPYQKKLIAVKTEKRTLVDFASSIDTTSEASMDSDKHIIF